MENAVGKTGGPVPNTAALVVSLPAYLDNIVFASVGLDFSTEILLDNRWEASIDPYSFVAKVSAGFTIPTPVDSNGGPLEVLGLAVYDRDQSVLFYLDVFAPETVLPTPSLMAVLEWFLNGLTSTTGVWVTL